MHVLTEVFLQLFVRAQDLSILEEVREPELQRGATVKIDGVRNDWGDDSERERDLLVGWGVYKWPEGWPLMVVGIGTQITSRLGFEDKGR